MPDTAAMPLVLSEGDSAQYDASIQAALADSSLVVPQASEWVNWQVKKGEIGRAHV